MQGHSHEFLSKESKTRTYHILFTAAQIANHCSQGSAWVPTVSVLCHWICEHLSGHLGFLVGTKGSRLWTSVQLHPWLRFLIPHNRQKLDNWTGHYVWHWPVLLHGTVCIRHMIYINSVCLKARLQLSVLVIVQHLHTSYSILDVFCMCPAIKYWKYDIQGIQALKNLFSDWGHEPLLVFWTPIKSENMKIRISCMWSLDDESLLWILVS